MTLVTFKTAANSAPPRGKAQKSVKTDKYMRYVNRNRITKNRFLIFRYLFRRLV